MPHAERADGRGDRLRIHLLECSAGHVYVVDPPLLLVPVRFTDDYWGTDDPVLTFNVRGTPSEALAALADKVCEIHHMYAQIGLMPGISEPHYRAFRRRFIPEF